MAAHDAARTVQISFSRTEVELVRVALRHLLASEDDPETIAELKTLLARLASAAERDPD
jgi:hypothetical protein